MNSKRDIFWQDKIYLQVADGESRYNYQSYPVQGSHSFKDRDDVTGRYELGYQWQTDFKGKGKRWEDCTQAVYSMAHVGLRRIVAIPLPTPAPVADNTDHIFNPVAGLPKEAALTAKELVEKFFIADSGDIDCHITWSAAKQCALISINREIDLINRLLDTNLNNDFDLLRERGELQDVRTAINQI